MKKFIIALQYFATSALFILFALSFFDEEINPYKVGFFFIAAVNNLFFLMFEEVEVIFGDE